MVSLPQLGSILMATKCFMIHPLPRRAQWLRRLVFTEGRAPKPCDVAHDAFSARIADAEAPLPAPREPERIASRPADFAGDPRWPARCARCDYELVGDEGKKVFDLRLYADGAGREFVLPGRSPLPGVASAPAGAMWLADGLHHGGRCLWWDNCTEPHLMVSLPGGYSWDVDSRASNCTLENRLHRCWIRSGTPPVVTVSKNGNTCAAGAGSIAVPGYHGFLRDGYLT